MKQKQAIQLFEEKRVRTVWDTEQEKWWFSIVDVTSVLIDSDYQTARKYWKVLKGRLIKEGFELVTNCYQLKMQSTDGKYYLTDVADTEQLLRIIQSIPSPKDEWKRAGLEEGQQFASLTDIIYRQWSGLSAMEYKQLKGLKKENLRDNMTDLEIAINMLAEATTTQISKNENPKGMAESANVAKRGGAVANDARKAVEKETSMPVVSAMNAKQIALGENELLPMGGEE